MIIVLKDTTSYSVAKRIAPSLFLLKGPITKIRKRTTLGQRIGKLFMAVLSLPARTDYNRQQIAWRKLPVLGSVKI